MFCASSSLSTLQSHKKPGYCTPPIQKLLLKNHLHVVCKPCSTTERTEKLINHIPPIFIVVHRFYCWNCNQWRNAPAILGRYFYLTTFILQVLVLVSNTEYSHVFVDLILSCSEANKQSYYTRRLSEQSIMSLCLLNCRLSEVTIHAHRKQSEHKVALPHHTAEKCCGETPSPCWSWLGFRVWEGLIQPGGLILCISLTFLST